MSHRSCSQSVGVGALKTRPTLAMTDSHALCAALRSNAPHQPPLSHFTHTLHISHTLKFDYTKLNGYRHSFPYPLLGSRGWNPFKWNKRGKNSSSYGVVSFSSWSSHRFRIPMALFHSVTQHELMFLRAQATSPNASISHM
ncbi:uncharacterized protein LOC124389291 [Tachysurus ichikawai]